MNTLSLLLALILRAAPAELADRPHPGPLRETIAERRDRMESIAADVWAVAQAERPLPGMSRQDTALALLAVAFVESGFRLDVDRGQCAPGWCDNGFAVCLAQIHPRDAEERRLLLASRQACFAAELRVMRGSIGACKEPGAALALYTGPACDAPSALEGSRIRLGAIRAWRTKAAEFVAQDSKGGA